MYAVIVMNGKQYKVAGNDVLKVDRLEAEVGSIVQFDQVLAIGGANGTLRLGTPTVEGAKISAEVLEQKRDAKVIVFKKKRRHNYRRKNGHRQYVTVLRILDVSGNGGIEKKAVIKIPSVEVPVSEDQSAKKVQKSVKKVVKNSGEVASGKKKVSAEGKPSKSPDKKKTASKK